MHKGLVLRLYLAFTRFGAVLARRHLRSRLKRGKEDPDRISEKWGVPSCDRPAGPLVWLHAVGVGEVLALPSLAVELQKKRPKLQILITSSSRTSAQALVPNLPSGVIHQYLPLDIGPWRTAFLDHWSPDLSVWAERDVWPGFIYELHQRSIPLALVNARMDDRSFRSKLHLKHLFENLYSRFSLVEAQDDITANNLRQLGASDVHVTGSLKTSAAPLADQPEAREKIEQILKGRPVWIAASTHQDDEHIVSQAHNIFLNQQTEACLIIAPRDPNRATAVEKSLQSQGIDAEILPPDNIPTRNAQAYVVSAIGQLGLWYRVASVAFVGGSLGTTGGHNPWEPARLGAAILHGPCVTNFSNDYKILNENCAAKTITDAQSLAAALTDPKTLEMAQHALSLAQQNTQLAAGMAERLVDLMEAS